MALKTVQRVTFSLPKTTILKLEIRMPKSKRSKYIAELIEKDNRTTKKEVTIEDINAYWDNLAKHFKTKVKKTAVEMQREDRLSH